jgi:Protein of unknown function (DUF2628)
MPTFTVHAPPPRKGENAAAPERFVFVRDGFHFWAFALAPLWLLVHRLWLVLIGYFVLNGLIGAGLYVLGVSDSVGWAVGLLIALLVGLEASTLWRWTLARRGWSMLGFAVGDDLETAEQRFFAAWAERVPAIAALPATSAVPPRLPPASDVIGLFPEPGRTR